MGSNLLGRAAELGILERQLTRTIETSESQVVLVRGEPGIGKSALLRCFVESVPAVASGRPVLVGYGQSMTNSLGSDAFQAIRECLRSLVSVAERSASRETLRRVAGAFRTHAPDWLESVPIVGQLLAAGVKTGVTAMQGRRPPDQALNSWLDQLTGLVSELLGAGPLVLVVDDLHWADSATIDVIMALALKVHGPLLLVMAYRPDDLRPEVGGEPHPLTRAVFRLRRYRGECVEIDLPRLSAADTRSLIMAARHEHAISEGDVQRLVEQSAGIPLYAESLAVVSSHGQVSIGEGGPPREIAAVLEERLSFASAEDQRLLEVAIVVGFAFEVEFVAALARLDLDAVYDQFDRLMREHHLIVEAESVGAWDRYALHHPLLGEVLRRRAGSNAPRWRRYHQRLVGILLNHQVSDELAVRAAAAAVVARDPRAAALALDGARRQYAAGAVSEARALVEVAVSSAQGTALFFDASELLARSLSVEANHRAAAGVCKRALDQVEPGTVSDSRVWELTLLQARSLRMTNEWASAVELLTVLEQGLPLEARDARAAVLMLRAEIALCGPAQDTAGCIALCDQVVTLAPDSELVSRALGHRGLAHLAAYEADEAQQWLTRAIELAHKEGHPFARYEAMHWLSKKKMACLELDEAWSLLQRLEETSEASGVASDNPFHRRDASRVLGLRGDPDAAGAAFVQFFDLLPRRDHGRALTVLTCQIYEMDTLYGISAADRMLETIAITGAAQTSMHGEILAVSVGHLRTRLPRNHPLAFAVEVLGVDAEDAVAAEAIFRFDVPDLGQLRRSVAP